ncbi:MAG TPA: TetR family transcriptional regulator [Candidatus Dormibacteraeota bacterium]|nr:TetR family transcriptional regulator [Candidatus Dormibacteraeota bacterium]
MSRVAGTPGRRPGRRAGPTESRADILAAARRLFAERGYDGATIRAIAQEAGVDAALVHHFFGTKEQVFVAAMELPFQPADLLPQLVGGPREQVGERFVRVFLALWRDPERRAPVLALLRSATTNEQAAEMIRQFVTEALLTRLAGALDISPLRVTAAASQLVGMAMLRYLVGVEPLASADEEEIVHLVAPTIQRYLDGG